MQLLIPTCLVSVHACACIDNSWLHVMSVFTAAATTSGGSGGGGGDGGSGDGGATGNPSASQPKTVASQSKISTDNHAKQWNW